MYRCRLHTGMVCVNVFIAYRYRLSTRIICMTVAGVFLCWQLHLVKYIRIPSLEVCFFSQCIYNFVSLRLLLGHQDIMQSAVSYGLYTGSFMIKKIKKNKNKIKIKIKKEYETQRILFKPVSTK